MMQYQRNYNFIPKEKTETQSEEIKESLNIKDDPTEVENEKISSLKEENKKLLLDIENLKKKLEEAENLIIQKRK